MSGRGRTLGRERVRRGLRRALRPPPTAAVQGAAADRLAFLFDARVPAQERAPASPAPPARSAAAPPAACNPSCAPAREHTQKTTEAPPWARPPQPRYRADADEPEPQAAACSLPPLGEALRLGVELLAMGAGAAVRRRVRRAQRRFAVWGGRALAFAPEPLRLARRLTARLRH